MTDNHSITEDVRMIDEAHHHRLGTTFYCIVSWNKFYCTVLNDCIAEYFTILMSTAEIKGPSV